MMPINQVIYAHSIGDEIGQAFKNLNSGPLGNKTITDPSMDIDYHLLIIIVLTTQVNLA